MGRLVIREPGTPRLLRRVVKWDRQGKPKIARDYRSHIQIEHIIAKMDRACAAGKYCRCKTDSVDGFRYLIKTGQPYAKVIGTERRYMAGRYIPVPKDYHLDCVPEKAKPLVRFLVSRNP